MTEHDRNSVYDWLLDMANSPVGFRMHYSEEEEKRLAGFAVTMMKRLILAKPLIIKAEFPYRKSVAYCGACGMRIRMAQNARDEYCGKCGRPVEWN